MDRPTYIASCSFGKDSIATILLAMLHHEPLDRIVSVEVMFDNARGISGENPEHIQWVKEIAIPRLKELTGIDTDLIRNEKIDYISEFYHIVTQSKHQERNGKYQGFLISGRCRMNDACKMTPLKRYWRQFNGNHISYVGIAADEPERLARLDGNKSVSLLAKYGYTEKMAYDLCAKYDLLSPNYIHSTRGGCWFCPNCRIREFAQLRQRHPDLWNELIKLSNEKNIVSNKFNRSQSIHDIEKQMDFYKRQTQIEF